MSNTPRRGAYIHKEHPKSCAADDFWGQVSRTVNGVPVGDDQINMIVNSIRTALQFETDDVLLDLGCGNGALSKYVFLQCSSILGVDFSEYLVSVAKDNFERLPSFAFAQMDAVTYVDVENDPGRFSNLGRELLCVRCSKSLASIKTRRHSADASVSGREDPRSDCRRFGRRAVSYD